MEAGAHGRWIVAGMSGWSSEMVSLGLEGEMVDLGEGFSYGGGGG